MELTGKCKEEFEKWLILQDWYDDYYIENKEIITSFCDSHVLISFERLPYSMKYGVFIDYFNSVNYKVYVAYNEVAHKWNWHIDFKPLRDDCNGYPEFEIAEARIEAIKKANELRNKKLDGLQDKA